MDQAVVFGKYQNLVGTVTHPSDKSSTVAAIFLTAGMLHQAGPFRLYVDLARALADKNICSMRFDLSGIGESLAVGVGGQSIDRAANETAQAMDYLQNTYHIDKFILFGLCSGADDSVHTAVKDNRVVGLVTLDGCGYRTARFRWIRLTRHIVPRLLMPSKWMRLIQRLMAQDDEALATLKVGADIREYPTRDDAANEFKILLNRGVQMHFIYTSGIAEYYNYENQFFEMFSDVSWNGLASTKFFPHMDHVAMLCEDRNELVQDVSRRMIGIANSY